MKKIFIILLSLTTLLFVGCGVKEGSKSTSRKSESSVVSSTTTLDTKSSSISEVTSKTSSEISSITSDSKVSSSEITSSEVTSKTSSEISSITSDSKVSSSEITSSEKSSSSEKTSSEVTSSEKSSSSSQSSSSTTTLFKIKNMTIKAGDTQRIVPTCYKTQYDKISYSVMVNNGNISLNDGYIQGLKSGVAVVKAYVTNTPKESLEFSVEVTGSVVEGKESFYVVNDYLLANKKAGIYGQAFSLQLAPTSSNYQIYYTLDSSIPTKNSTLYTGDIEIKNLTNTGSYSLTKSVQGDPTGTGGSDKCYSQDYYNNIERNGNYPKISMGNVITVAVYDGDTLLAKQSLTYIIKSNYQEYFSVPVVSVSMPYENWFGKNGIYNELGKEDKVRANLEYYDITTGESFYYNTQIKLGGGWSKGYPQRTLNVNFNKDDLGNKNTPTTVGIFGEQAMDGDSNNLISEFTRFRLHNGGNNFEGSLHFNDALLQELADGTNVSTTSYRPCIVYLNGEYWGYYAIREHYSDTYFADNFGVKKADVVHYNFSGATWSLEEGDETQSPILLNDFLTYVQNCDTTKQDQYEYLINNYLDKDSFIDALIFEGFAHNWDYVANYNNFRMWRTVKVDSKKSYYDGKWRACLHDVDFSFQSYDGNYLVPCDFENYFSDMKSVDYSYDKFIIYNKLLDNTSFRADLVARVKELANTRLSYPYICSVLDNFASQLRPILADHVKRWGSNYTVSNWEFTIASIKKLLEYRCKYFVNTTIAIYGTLENNGTKVYEAQGLNSIDTVRSEAVYIYSNSFTMSFTAYNNGYNTDIPGHTYDCRFGIVFNVNGGEFYFEWDPSYWYNCWGGTNNLYPLDGDNVQRVDYLNFGVHNFDITYTNGQLIIKIDDLFTRKFSVHDCDINVVSCQFFVRQASMLVNNVVVNK